MAVIELAFGVWAGLFFLAVLWAVLGVYAFVKSLICATKTPSLLKGVLGITLAIIFGPLYFIYPMMDPTYCKASSDTSHYF